MALSEGYCGRWRIPENTTRAQLHDLSHVRAEQSPIDNFSPKVKCSFFLMRFEHPGMARDFVAAATKRPAFQFVGQPIWSSWSKTKEERDRNKLLRALGHHFVDKLNVAERARQWHNC
eukprot:417021-Amphidinium_carterae.1